MAIELKPLTVEEFTEALEDLLEQIGLFEKLNVDTKLFYSNFTVLEASIMGAIGLFQQQKDVSEDYAEKIVEFSVKTQNALISGGIDVRTLRSSDLTEEAINQVVKNNQSSQS